MLEEVRGHDAILLGAIGDPGVPSGVLERGCCCGFASSSTSTSTCAPGGCSRASRRPLAAPGDIDFVVVREGTEGPYTGNGGALRVGTPTRSRPR